MSSNENKDNVGVDYQSGGYIKIAELTDLIESTKNHEDDFEKLAVPVLTTSDNKINPQKLFFHGVYKMIEGAEKIECISWKSLYGFIFSVEVPNVNIETEHNRLYFKNGNIGKTTGTKFGEYITKILLKFSFASKSNGKVPQDFKMEGTSEDIKKYTINADEFLKEAQTQSTINGSTCTTRLSICPDVLDFSWMDSETALKLIEIMKIKIVQNDKFTSNVLNYMIDILNKTENNYQLGMLSTEYANEFNTYYQMEQNAPNTINKEITYLVVANMMWLFTTGYIHLDLHKQNVMISESPECSKGDLNKICIWFIDMGRMFDIKDSTKFITDINKRLNPKIDTNSFNSKIKDFQNTMDQLNYILDISVEYDNLEQYGSNYKNIFYELSVLYNILDRATNSKNTKSNDVIKEQCNKILNNIETFSGRNVAVLRSTEVADTETAALAKVSNTNNNMQKNDNVYSFFNNDVKSLMKNINESIEKNNYLGGRFVFDYFWKYQYYKFIIKKYHLLETLLLSAFNQIIEIDTIYMKSYNRNEPQCKYLIDKLNTINREWNEWNKPTLLYDDADINNETDKNKKEQMKQKYDADKTFFKENAKHYLNPDTSNPFLNKLIKFLMNRTSRNKNDCINLPLGSERYKMDDGDIDFYKLSYLGKFHDLINDKTHLIDIKSNAGLDKLITDMGGNIDGVQTYLSQTP
jgi:hypothetical protein